MSTVHDERFTSYQALIGFFRARIGDFIRLHSPMIAPIP